MPRNKKSEDDQKISVVIGKRVADFRHEKHWNLIDLAMRMGISAPHLKALESGRYSFSAPLLYKLAMAFGKPAGAFMPNLPQHKGDTHVAVWQDLYDTLTARDRQAMLDLGRSLAGDGDQTVLQCWKRMAAGSGHLISMEGIDGAILEEQGRLLVDRLIKKEGKSASAMLCLYDFNSELWKFMFNRFKEIEVDAYRAFERTLFFACERIHRQETRIRPLLSQGKKVVTTFFFLAPIVYQQMEGLMDAVAIQAISNFFIEPEVTIVLDSNADAATKKAVPHRPRPGQFWSPYHAVELFEHARNLYLKTTRRYQERGAKIHIVDANQEKHKVAAQINKIVSSEI